MTDRDDAHPHYIETSDFRDNPVARLCIISRFGDKVDVEFFEDDSNAQLSARRNDDGSYDIRAHYMAKTYGYDEFNGDPYLSTETKADIVLSGASLEETLSELLDFEETAKLGQTTQQKAHKKKFHIHRVIKELKKEGSVNVSLKSDIHKTSARRLHRLHKPRNP